MTPTVGGTIDSNFFRRYDATVEAAKSSGSDPYIILDLVSEPIPCNISYPNSSILKHNYARWNGRIIGQGGPTNEQYASLWSQLAAKYKDNQKIIVGNYISGMIWHLNYFLSLVSWTSLTTSPISLAGSLLYKPLSTPSALLALLINISSSQVEIISRCYRSSVDVTSQGSSWSSAQALPNEAGPQLLTVTDPSGGTDRLIFDGTSLSKTSKENDNHLCHYSPQIPGFWQQWDPRRMYHGKSDVYIWTMSVTRFLYISNLG